MEAHEGEIKIDSGMDASAPTAEPDHSPAAPKLHRERDSLDDFEHLDRESSPAKESSDARAPTPEEAVFGTPERTVGAAGEGTRSLQAFLDTEREELLVEPARLPATPTAPAPAPPTAPVHAPPATPPPTPPEPAPVVAPPAEPPRQEPPPAVREPSPSHHDTVYSDSREELSEEEQERPLPRVTPATAPPAPAPPPPAPGLAPSAPVPAFLQDIGLDALFQHPERLHPRVEALVYWRCPARSAAALGGGLALLVALACCSLISVLAYLALLTLAGTIAFRLYRNVAQAVQKTSDGHPFKDLLETDLSVSPEKAQEVAVWGTAHLNASVNELRRLFLVEDLVDSLKFGVMLWCFTYVGAWFNGMTLIIIGYVAFFTVPKIYETNKTQIDANLEVVSAKFQDFTNKVRAAIPIGKKTETEKEK